MLRLAAALAAMLVCGSACAASYPTRPLRLVTTFPPGGGADLVARAIGAKLQESWGHSFVIDNRPGAGGILGSEIVARAQPDGHTLLLGSNGGLILNSLINRTLPYDAFRDFAPISLLVINPQLLVAATPVPANTVKELIALLKMHPGALNYASVGRGSTTHLGMELFNAMTETSAVHVAYKGNGPAINAMVSGEVQLMFSNIPTVLPHVAAGRLKGLGVSTARRAQAAPDIPTIAEAGVEGFESVSWFGLYAPAKVSPEIVALLNRHVTAALRDASVVARLVAGGAEPRPGTPEALRAYMEQELGRWKAVVRAAKLQIE